MSLAAIGSERTRVGQRVGLTDIVHLSSARLVALVGSTHFVFDMLSLNFHERADVETRGSHRERRLGRRPVLGGADALGRAQYQAGAVAQP